MIVELMRRYTRLEDALPYALVATVASAIWPRYGPFVSANLLLFGWMKMPLGVSSYEASLPVSARALALSRLFSRLAFVGLPIVAWTMATVLRPSASWSIYTVVNVSLCVLIGVVLPFALHAGELGLSYARRISVPIFMVFVAVQLTIRLAPDRAIVVLAVALVVAFVVALTTQRDAMRVHVRSATRRAESHASGALAIRSYLSQSVRRALPSTRWIQLFVRSSLHWTLLPYFASAVTGGRGDWLIYVWLYGNATGWGLNTNSAWMNGLPFSHRVRLLTIVVPMLIVSAGGAALGRGLQRLRPVGRNDISHDAPYKYSRGHFGESRTNVSLAFWRLAPRGVPPVISADWGESTRADTVHVLGMVFYNPYTSRRANSARFVDMQFERVTAAVYGHAIPLAAYGPYRHSRPDWVTRALRVQILGAGVLVIVVLCSIATSMVYRSRRFTGSWLRVLVATLVSQAPCWAIGAVALYYRDVRAVTPLAQNALLALSRALPDGLLWVSVVALMPGLVVFALLERLSARIDLSIPQKTVLR